MGLFFTEDGHFRGWLAALLCCCAAVDEDEEPAERAKERKAEATRARICSEQPALIALPSTPSAHLRQRCNVDELKDTQSSKSGHSLKAVDLPSSSLVSRPNTNTIDAFARPCTRPTATAYHQVLVPLQLGPVVLRDAPSHGQMEPLSSTRQRPDSTRNPIGETTRRSYLENRETPFQRFSRSSTDILAAQAVPNPGRPSIAISAASAKSSSSSLRHLALESRSTNPKTTKSTNDSSRGPTRLKRKRSDVLIRKGSTSAADFSVEAEILELNTIIEERRNGNASSNRGSGHIPAIAPSMEVRARSETLNDIGSAFTRPMTSREIPSRPDTIELEGRSVQSAPSRNQSRSSNRISGWLSSVISSASLPPPPAPDSEPFYKCNTSSAFPRPLSQISLHSSSSESDLPGLTLAPSPTATDKAYTHSRSLTAESRLTPLLPVEMLYGSKIFEDGDTWRVSAPNRVGVAI